MSLTVYQQLEEIGVALQAVASLCDSGHQPHSFALLSVDALAADLASLRSLLAGSNVRVLSLADRPAREGGSSTLGERSERGDLRPPRVLDAAPNTRCANSGYSIRGKGPTKGKEEE